MNKEFVRAGREVGKMPSGKRLYVMLLSLSTFCWTLSNPSRVDVTFQNINKPAAKRKEKKVGKFPSKAGAIGCDIMLMMFKHFRNVVQLILFRLSLRVAFHQTKYQLKDQLYTKADL